MTRIAPEAVPPSAADRPDVGVRREPLAAVSRRGMLAGSGASVLATPAIVRAAACPHLVVVGAGVFGSWTAEKLRATGSRVTLIDAWGAANARASSGGESRLTRTAYGEDAIYSRMASESLPEWQALSAFSGLPIFHRTGVLFFFDRDDAYFHQSIAVARRLGLNTEALDNGALRRRWPQVDFSGVFGGLYEPRFGALMARRGVETLAQRFVAAGGEYRRAAVSPPDESLERLGALTLVTGERIAADRFIFACGPWLPKLFPRAVGARIQATRQEVFFFRPPPGDGRFAPGALPGWADFGGDDLFYGFPDLEGRGFKIANDRHGAPVDPDRGDRLPSPAALAEARAFIARRFPALAGAPLNEARVCQYENSSNGDFLIDHHPNLKDVVLLGAGSGHGFKHGPAVGRYAADLLLGRLAAPEPRFSLASKLEVQRRAVH